MPLNRDGTPSEISSRLDLLRSRSKRMYLLLIWAPLILLFGIGLFDKWEEGGGTLGGALVTLFLETYINFFSTLCGLLLSIFAAKYFFGSNPSEHTPQEAGIVRITQHQEATDVVREIYKKIESVGRGEVIISDNWLCSLKAEMKTWLEDAIINGIKKGAKISIIILHPNSPLGQRRELVVSEVGHMHRWHVKNTLKMLRHIYQKCVDHNLLDKAGAGSLNVYCSDLYSSLSAYVVPGQAHMGFYGSKDSSILGPQLLATMPSMIGDMVLHYAETAVKSAQHPKEVPSYDGILLKYGVEINLAAPHSVSETEYINLSSQTKEKLVELSNKAKERGALTQEEVLDHLLDSQAIDFFNMLSRANAAQQLATFITQHPSRFGERGTKSELTAVVKKLAELMRDNS